MAEKRERRSQCADESYIHTETWEERGRDETETWKRRGRDVEETRQRCGRDVEETWKRCGREEAGLWQRRGRDKTESWKRRGAGAQYGCGCVLHRFCMLLDTVMKAFKSPALDNNFAHAVKWCLQRQQQASQCHHSSCNRECGLGRHLSAVRL
jgi:hypothetical protein